MKKSSVRLLLYLGILPLLLLPVNGADTRITKVARIDLPPKGKVLVNIHGTFRDLVRYAIFGEDGTFLMDLPQHSECQLTCEPGTKSFIAIGSNVAVVTADLVADKVYDLAIDRQGFSTKFVILAQDPKYRKNLESIEKKEKDNIFTLERDEAAVKFEAAQKERLLAIKSDFLGGKKSGRVARLGKDDCR